MLTDQAGVAAMHRQGISHAVAANLYGLQGIFRAPTAKVPSRRTIDVLFVGNLHPAVQRERLSWLGRLARLQERWNVHITQGVFGEDYRRLLLSSRIVFNRTIRGEWNLRVGEACSCGALLFCEAGNLELPTVWKHGEDCIFYDEDNLESLLTHYLEHEDERRAIAESGRRKAEAHTFESMWDETLARIEQLWPEIQARHEQRPRLDARNALLARTWQALGAADRGDPLLAPDLDAALARSADAALLNARGLVAALSGRPTPDHLRAVGRYFHQSTMHTAIPGAVASLNLAESLFALDHKPAALQGVQRLLAQLLDGCPDEADLDQPHYPPGYDFFRVEWERAAWQNAGRPGEEARAKLALLQWRLHGLASAITGELTDFHAAVLARPDLPTSRGALGCALARSKRRAEAVGHLRFAVEANPFDQIARRSLFQALLDGGKLEQAETLKYQSLLLHLAAPSVAPAEEWLRQPSRGNLVPSGAGSSRPLVIHQEGAFLAQHSLGLVSRALCQGLLTRGHEISLTPLVSPGAAIEPGPTRGRLVGRFLEPLPRPEDVTIRLGWPPNWQPPAHGRWVVVLPWEYGSIPSAWLAPLSTLVDEVWAPSSFVRDGLLHSGAPAERVVVLPLGFDESIFRPGLEPLPLATSKRFKFLFVGGTIHRKGIDVLLAAYAQAFTSQDDVCLVIKDMGVGSFYQGQTAEKLIEEFRGKADHPEVLYLDDSLSDEEMARLYAGCDCLVQPYRGEGFGLPILEAMACRLPVIVTGYGAALDFCDAETAALIPARVVPFAQKRVGDMETVDFPHLAEPDPEALAALLRQEVAHPDEARRRARNAAGRVRASFTWWHVAGLAERRLLALREQPIRRLARPADRPVYVAAPVSANGPRPKLSVCLIVRNEEANLPACLDSIACLGADVVVCDTGSTDRTKEIAQARGARVVEFPWCDHFAKARNASLEHARGEWIFWLDADDRLDEENQQKLLALLDQLPNANVGYSMKCRCLPSAGAAETTVDHIRLFRNDPRIRWRYRIHEQILRAIQDAGGEIRWADVVITHTGYTDPVFRRKKLQERDLRLLLMEYAEQPHDPFTLFNLGMTTRELGDPAKALGYLQESLERSHPSDSIVRKLFVLIACCHQQLGNRNEALTVCLRGLAVCPNDAELLFHEALLRTDLCDYHGAKATLAQLLGTNSGQHFASVADGLRGYRARHQLALVCSRLREDSEAEWLWQAVLRDRPDFLPAHVGLGELFLAQQRFDDVRRQADLLAALPNGALDAALLCGKIHLEREEFTQARLVLEEASQRLPGCLPLLSPLSYALLREGRDPARAEAVLLDILRIAPNNAQARQNLEVLRRSSAASADQVFQGDLALGQLFQLARDGDSPLRQHLPLLHDLAHRSNHVTEFGSGGGTLTTALLLAQPDKLVCFDRVRHERMDQLAALRGRTAFTFRQEDVLWTQIEETDLLVTDTVGGFDQLHEELRRHAAGVRRWIVIARTSTFGENGEEGGAGLWPAIESFMAQGVFRLVQRHEGGAGLTVLERVIPGS